jgi:hypothetical protein
MKKNYPSNIVEKQGAILKKDISPSKRIVTSVRLEKIVLEIEE